MVVFARSRRRGRRGRKTWFSASANYAVNTIHRIGRLPNGKFGIINSRPNGTAYKGGLIPPPSRAPELKYIDNNIGTSAITNVPSTVTYLTPIVAGTGATNRIGNKILVKSIRLNGILTLNVTNPVPATVKIMFLLDKEPNANAPILTGANSSSGRMFDSTSVVNPYTLLDPVNTQRYTLLKQAYWNLKQAYTGSKDTTKIDMFYRFPKGGINLEFAANNAVSADIVSNSLHCVFISEHPIAGTFYPTFIGNTRVRFTDV